MYSAKIDLSAYQQTKIASFIFDPLMKRHTELALKHMGFSEVRNNDVPRNYYEALARIVSIVASDTELVLINLPPKPVRANGKNELVTVYDLIDENYQDMKSQLQKRNTDPLKHLSKTVPLIEVGDYLREKLIDVLVKYRVPAAFFMTAPMIPKKNETEARKAWKTKKNYELFYTEISTYLNYYFRDKDDLVALVDDRLTEKELSERKKKYDQFMEEAEKQKAAGDLDGAIAFLRQAIDIFPQDIEAFLESGRLYTRKREYGRALRRYGQAQDLFEEAPEPNKEIGTLRLVQVKEKIKEGLSPDSEEIKELLEEAVANYKAAHAKAADLVKKYPNEPDKGRPENITAIGAEIMKMNIGRYLGTNHPALKEFQGLIQETTGGLENMALEDLGTAECLTMAIQSLEKGNINSAEMYYFQALEGEDYFDEVCSQINLMGIKLRKQGQVTEALEIL